MLFVLCRTSSARVIRLQHVTWRRQSMFWRRSAPSCSTGRWPPDRFLHRSRRHASHRFWRRSAWILPMSARTGQSPICRWCRNCWSVWSRSSWWATWRRPACFPDCSQPTVLITRRKPQFWRSWLTSCGRSIPVTWRSWRCSTYRLRSIPWITPLCCVGWAWRTALTVPCWAGSGPTSAVVRSSSAAAPLGRLQRLCHAVSRRARSLGRFCSCCIPQIYWGSSKDMTSFLICMLTAHRSAATHLHRMPCSCRRRFQDASMTLQNGCSLIVFNWTQPRRKCSGVHPFDVSISFRSPVCVSATISSRRLLRSETSGFIWTATSAWGLMSRRWCPAASPCCADSAAFVRRLRGRSLCRLSCH